MCVSIDFCEFLWYNKEVFIMARQLKSVKEKVETSKIKINPRYDINTLEMLDLCKQEGATVEAAFLAFKYGYIQGTKAAKAEMRRAEV